MGVAAARSVVPEPQGTGRSAPSMGFQSPDEQAQSPGSAPKPSHNNSVASFASWGDDGLTSGSPESPGPQSENDLRKGAAEGLSDTNRHSFASWAAMSPVRANRCTPQSAGSVSSQAAHVHTVTKAANGVGPARGLGGLDYPVSTFCGIHGSAARSVANADQQRTSPSSETLPALVQSPEPTVTRGQALTPGAALSAALSIAANDTTSWLCSASPAMKPLSSALRSSDATSRPKRPSQGTATPGSAPYILQGSASAQQRSPCSATALRGYPLAADSESNSEDTTSTAAEGVADPGCFDHPTAAGQEMGVLLPPS